MSCVSIRVDEETKQAASKIAEDFGFDLSSITRAFYKQIVREQRIPLNLSYSNPNLASLEAISEGKEILGNRHKRFSNSSEMFESLDI